MFQPLSQHFHVARKALAKQAEKDWTEQKKTAFLCLGISMSRRMITDLKKHEEKMKGSEMERGKEEREVERDLEGAEGERDRPKTFVEL
jgi:hypothetical protein